MQEKGYITIRLADSDRERLERLAEQAERSLSAEVRLAIREHLAKAEEPDGVAA